MREGFSERGNSMKIFDQHVHSNFSFDSQAEMLEECQSAIEKGVSGINFTEHYSVDEVVN